MDFILRKLEALRKPVLEVQSNRKASTDSSLHQADRSIQLDNSISSELDNPIIVCNTQSQELFDKANCFTPYRVSQSELVYPMIPTVPSPNSIGMQLGVPATFRLIGGLTPEQRQRKVNKYLQKRKNRKWNNVKYEVRHQLAQTRRREGGRFVKSEKWWLQNMQVESQAKQQVIN